MAGFWKFPWDFPLTRPTRDPSLLEDTTLTDIRFSKIEFYKNEKSPNYPSNPKNRPGTTLFLEPTHSTTNLQLYLISNARRMDIQMYGWQWQAFQDALVARKDSQPDWDVKVLINRNGYIDAGPCRDMVNAEPRIQDVDWFTLGTGEGDTNGNHNSGRIMHRKAMIIDDVWFCHGSTNLDTSSIEFQGNTFSITYDPELCAEMKILFDRTRDWNEAKGDSWCRVLGQTA